MNSDFSEVRSSFGRCLLSPDFFEDFYKVFQEKSPLIRERFKNTDMKAQKALLRNGLTHLIMYAEGSEASKMKVGRLAESHDTNHLNIPAWMYDKWEEALMTVVQKHDHKITRELLSLWHQAIRKGIDFMIAKH